MNPTALPTTAKPDIEPDDPTPLVLLLAILIIAFLILLCLLYAFYWCTSSGKAVDVEDTATRTPSSGSRLKSSSQAQQSITSTLSSLRPPPSRGSQLPPSPKSKLDAGSPSAAKSVLKSAIPGGRSTASSFYSFFETEASGTSTACSPGGGSGLRRPRSSAASTAPASSQKSGLQLEKSTASNNSSRLVFCIDLEKQSSSSSSDQVDVQFEGAFGTKQPAEKKKAKKKMLVGKIKVTKMSPKSRGPRGGK